MGAGDFRSVEELLKAHGKPPREVYLDCENSPWVPPEVIDAMLPYFNTIGYGNPLITHKAGWEAYEAYRRALIQIARPINADPQQFIITHSGTEANNLAIKGYVLANKDKGRKIVVSEIEHLSVIFTAEYLKNCGFEVVKVPVDAEGFIDLEKLADIVDRETILVSIMLVNHEIGTIEPLREAVEVVKDKNPDVVFHTDAADAYGKIKFDVEKLGVDMVSLSARKIYGPRGVGALYVREGIRLEKLIHGQISIEELWPGVENVPLVMGFAKASELIFKDFDRNVSHMRKLRDMLIDGILSSIPYTFLNGPKGDRRAPDNVNISFLYCEGEAMVIELSTHGVYVSSGSACASRMLEPSHVLLAIGRKFEEVHGSLLMKVTPYHTVEDIKYVLEVLPKAVERIRSISALKPEGD
ncbi:MAG: cysteine desulfurase family protein [Candidatus Baldrarchaeia archaeon]